MWNVELPRRLARKMGSEAPVKFNDLESASRYARRVGGRIVVRAKGPRPLAQVTK